MERDNDRCEEASNFGGVQLIEESTEVPTGYDFAWMIEVVEHLQDAELQESIELARHALKPGGYLVITTPNREDIEAMERICPDCGAIFHPKQHVRSWSRESLARYLEEKGFSVPHALETNWLEHKNPKLLRAAKLAYRGVQQFWRSKTLVMPHLGVIAKKKGS